MLITHKAISKRAWWIQ